MRSKSIIEENYRTMQTEYGSLNHRTDTLNDENRNIKSQFDQKVEQLLLRNKELENKFMNMQSQYEQEIQKRNDNERRLTTEVDDLKEKLISFLNPQNIGSYIIK